VVKIVELLAPARDFAALNAAISNGADSVYLGIHGYNLRAYTKNFTIKDIKKAVKHCHDFNKKIYVCTNTIIKDNDIIALNDIIPRLYSYDVDAMIVSDLGALKIARDNDMDVHISVQANISNTKALELLEDLCVKRVILSRELSLDEIKIITKKSKLEIEVFVHGAMCMAVSGRCFLSSYLYNKSANCGECLQPCREEWKLVSEDLEELKLIRGHGDYEKTHLMSPKDLCMIEHIPNLIESGIDAFKIEGRARAADYVSTVTKVYREAIDKYEKSMWELDENWIHDLKKVYNRGFDTGFYFKPPYKNSKYNESSHIKKDIGLVCNYYHNVSAAEVRLWDDLEVGDEILVQGNTTGSLIQKVKSIQINGKDIKNAKRGDNVGILVKRKVRPNDRVYKRIPRNALESPNH